MLGPLGRPFEVDPRSRHLLLVAGRPRDGRRPDAGRRGDPRRPPGHAAVRGAERARGVPVDAPARRGRVRRGDRRRLARPPRLRDRARAGATRPGPTRPSPAARCRCWARSPASRSGRRRRLGVAAWAGSAAAAGPIPPARPRRAGRRSCRCRWSRTWAARWRVPRAASSWHDRRAAAGLSRGPGLRGRTSSTGRAAGEGEAPRRHQRGGRRPPKRRPTVRRSNRRSRRPPARRGAPGAARAASAPGRAPPSRSRAHRGARRESTCRSTSGAGLVLRNPILVASGTFGYGIEYGDVVDVQRLGAICCKGTTLGRASATRRRA